VRKVTGSNPVLNSWLSYNGINVKLKVNIRGESDTPRIADKRVPNKEELDRILRMATPRGRVSIALMAFSGLRPESLGNYDGSVVYFGFEVWRFFWDRGVAVRRKPLQPSKPVGRAAKALEQNHMLISCPKCKKVFSKPLVMLDFSSGKTRLVNVCPYCNHVLGSAEEAEKEDVGVFDLEKKKVEH
jgi:uncharacterized Zn-finger protein